MKMFTEPDSDLSLWRYARRVCRKVSFFVRVKGLQSLRVAQNIFSRCPRLEKGAIGDFPDILAESISILHTTNEPNEKFLMLGKIENLRVACQRIDKRILRAGEIFSLWRQIGPPWRSRGFAVGREVREGCIVPTIGGGLCQFSGALMELASRLGFTIIERHRHTALPPDVRYIEQRDATLFWNYIDLRFSVPYDVLFEAYLTEKTLVVCIRSIASPRQQTISSAMLDIEQQHAPRNTLDSSSSSTRRKVAYLLGDPQPEFTRHVNSLRNNGDVVFVPFDAPFDDRETCETNSPPLYKIRRSMALRWSVARKKTVAKTHFALAETLANYYAKHLHYSVEHVCIAQTLLPYLWKSGKLQGRSFDVMMYRAPIEVIENELESAVKLYPQSKTLREFRAPEWFAETEREALLAARSVITPHAYIASVYENAVELPWDDDAPEKTWGDEERDLVVFLGPTLARKGCYAVRDAISRLGIPLTIVGSELEGPDFWKGLSVTHCATETLPWERVHTVVQPALFEYWPRQLLRAHRTGARLLITPGCGIREDARKRIWHVPFGDADALAKALCKSLEQRG